MLVTLMVADPGLVVKIAYPIDVFMVTSAIIKKVM